MSLLKQLVAELEELTSGRSFSQGMSGPIDGSNRSEIPDSALSSKGAKVGNAWTANVPVICDNMAQRSPIVAEEIELLGRHVGELYDLVGTLEKRLGGVLRNDPRPEMDKDGRAMPTVPYASRVAEISGQAASIAYSLKSVLDRLEV